MFCSFHEFVWIRQWGCQVHGLNYGDWFEQINFQLGVMDLDLAIVMDEKPVAITDIGTDEERSIF